ncbi:hypothetical protein [Actinocatenispora thailandica]|nr:hypothetical protein [Actinocatenispora thailandica]
MVVTSLGAAGIGELDESVYRYALAHGDVTPGGVALALGIGTERAARSLDRLRTDGLLHRLGGRRRRYGPSEPRVAVEALLRARTAELDATRSAVDELVALFHNGQAPAPDTDAIQVLHGAEALGHWFVRLQQEARDEVLSLDRPPYALTFSNPIEPVTLGQGVRYRVVYAPEALDQPGGLDEIRRQVAGGEQARVMPGLLLKMTVADRRRALLPLSLDFTEVRAVVVHRSTLLDGLVDLFESYWRRAVPLSHVLAHRAAAQDPPDAPDDGQDDAREPRDAREAGEGVDPDDRELLAMLVSGLKDEAVARQLGWSLRTMRRRVQRLHQRLGATNRFQAGVQAARRGWI